MATCTHCRGTGECQDDFHSGTRGPFGGDSGDGVDHPDYMEHMFGRCPSCGGDNTEMRPDCPHCNGSGEG